MMETNENNVLYLLHTFWLKTFKHFENVLGLVSGEKYAGIRAFLFYLWLVSVFDTLYHFLFFFVIAKDHDQLFYIILWCFILHLFFLQLILFHVIIGNFVSLLSKVFEFLLKLVWEWQACALVLEFCLDVLKVTC